MTTGAEKTVIALKRLMAAEDFRERFLDYVNGQLLDTRGRVWDTHGVIGQNTGDQISPGGGFTPNHILIAQGGLQQFLMTDGIGNFITLGEPGGEDASIGQIKLVVFENLAATQYFVSLHSALMPRNVQVNPRTGVPEYSREVEVVGDRADVDQVIDNGTNITFVIDGVVREANHSHAGRTAVVFKKTPARGATSDAIAIESLTVFWTGTQNRVTTSGQLGQVSPSLDPADYEVVLLGPSIAKRNTILEEGHAHIGIINGTGPGGTPGLGTIAAQKLFDKSLADAVIYDGGPAWFDGTPNNGPISFAAQFDKIINDLSGWTGGANGAAKVQCAGRANWADGTVNSLSTGTYAAINKIITDLTTLAGGRGADKLTCAALPNWADGGTLPAVRLFQMLEAIVNALAGATGTQKIGGAAYVQGDASISAGTLRSQLQEIIDQIDVKLSPGEAVQAATNNTFTGTNTFENLVDITAAPLVLGEDFLDTGEEAEIPRISTRMIGGLGGRTLILHIPETSGYRDIRVYAANGVGINNEAIEITINAYWDDTTFLWNLGPDAADAYIFVFGRLRMAFAQSFAASGGDGFGTGQFWHNVFFRNNINSGVSALTYRNGTIQIDGHTAAQISSDSDRLNFLSARNICKAWGHLRQASAGGGGALTVTDVFNITSITFDAVADDFIVTIGGNMAFADYAITGAYLGSNPGRSINFQSEAATGFRVAVTDTKTGVDATLPDTNETELSFAVYGPQTTPAT